MGVPGVPMARTSVQWPLAQSEFCEQAAFSGRPFARGQKPASVEPQAPPVLTHEAVPVQAIRPSLGMN